ncbi:unnamed protein product [Blepharisma stoltei]|uniref:DUF962 domain-containing protein n=1 Tax=Blepharisma stoltei TaxID=1481888 RepID=A0AAU9KDF1_9CILI|nr:unnamed protein product [Blepharisma stoltei]
MNKKDIFEDKEDPNEIARKIHKLVWDNFFKEYFSKTRKSLYLGLVGPFIVWAGFGIYNPTHPVKPIFMISVGIGGILHACVQFSRDTFAVADTDTEVGAKMRLYHQKLAMHSFYFPYFKHETLRAVEHREKLKKSQSSK